MPPGTLAVPTTFATEVGNTSTIPKLDANFAAIVAYVNNRVPASGLLANRLAAGNAGARYYATDTGIDYLDTGVAWIAVNTPAVTDQLTGLALSNDGGAPNTVLDVAAGACASDDAAVGTRILMTLAAFTKSTAAWAVGNGNGGMASGAAVAIATWYAVFVIERPDTGVVDVAFDTSATGANLAANTNAAYTKKRRIGWMRTAAASTNIVTFTQSGDFVWWLATVLDVNSVNPGVGAVSRTLTVPPASIAMVNLLRLAASSAGYAHLSPLAVNDEAPAVGAAPLGIGGTTLANEGTSMIFVLADAASQVRSRLSVSGPADAIRVATLGYYDRRGRG